jgi:hypothetical protein
MGAAWRREAAVNLATTQASSFHLWERAAEPDVVVRVRRCIVQVQGEPAIIGTVVPIAAGNRTAGRRGPPSENVSLSGKSQFSRKDFTFLQSPPVKKRYFASLPLNSGARSRGEYDLGRKSGVVLCYRAGVFLWPPCGSGGRHYF